MASLKPSELEFGEEAFEQREFLHRVALGDLEHDALARDAAVADDLADILANSLSTRARGREVDEDAAIVAELLQLTQRAFDDERVEAMDDAHLLRRSRRIPRRGMISPPTSMRERTS